MTWLLKKGVEAGRRNEVLCNLIKGRGIHIVPGVFNASTALLAQRLGFKAVYASGAAFSASLGLPDIGLITLPELAEHVRCIAHAVHIPIIVDADTGFGEAVNVVRAVKELEEAGASALQIEDQQLPKKCGHLAGKSLVSPREMVEKIRAAVRSRRDPNFAIIARTDSRAVHGLEEAVDRAQLYHEAGADIIFPEALRSLEEFRELAKKVKAPLLANMTEFGRTPYISAKQFEKLGYKLVIFPVTLFRVAMKAAEEALLELKRAGTQKNLLAHMQTRKQLYETIHYRTYEAMDREIAREASMIAQRKRGESL